MNFLLIFGYMAVVCYFDCLGIMKIFSTCIENKAAEAALEKEFLEGIDKGSEVRQKYSVVMYGVPAEILDEAQLGQWVLNFLRDSMKLTSLSASDIHSVKRMRGSELCKPVQLTMKSFQMKEDVLFHRKFIKYSSVKIENFIQREDMVKIAKLVKIAKSLRQVGHFAVVKDELLFVDHVQVNTTESSLLHLFPYLPKSLFIEF